MPFNDSFHGKIIILLNFLDKVQNLLCGREKEIYARLIMLKEVNKRTLGNFHLWRRCLFIVWHFLDSQLLRYNVETWQKMHRIFFLNCCLLNFTLVSNSWRLGEGYEALKKTGSDVTLPLPLSNSKIMNYYG